MTRSHISCYIIFDETSPEASQTIASSAPVWKLLQHLLAYQRLSLRLGTSDVSNEGFCCNLCAPLVLDTHLKQSSWADTPQGCVQQACFE